MRPQKFMKIAEDIALLLNTGQVAPGMALPSQHQLASQYRVSRSSIQKALDHLAGRGLVDKRPGRGVFARDSSVAKRRLKTIALILPDYFRMTTHDRDNFGLNLLQGIEEEARERGARLLIRCLDTKSELHDPVPAARRLEADALIVHYFLADRAIEQLRGIGIPIVVIGRSLSLPGVGFVAPNYYDHALRLLKEMASTGIRDIGIMYSARHFSAPEFLAAGERAAKETATGTSIRFFNYFPENAPDTDDLDEEFVNHALAGLLAADRLPQVLLCHSDWIAWRAMQYLMQNNVAVPDTVGVIGCLGLELGLTCTPQLTTLALDARVMGRRTVAVLQKAAGSGKSPEIERIPLLYTERKSFRMKVAERTTHERKETGNVLANQPI